MPIADALAAVAVLASPYALDNFRSHLDPEWIEQALRATGGWGSATEQPSANKSVSGRK